MQIELSAEEQQAMEKAVANGQFTSVDEAVHAAVQNLADEHTEWLAYTQQQIQLGLNDVAAGRVIEGHDFLRELNDLRDPA